MEWALARVAEIFKGKGDATDPSSYRPISLLSAVYKVYARIIQRRLAAAIDHRLLDTQFGFRADRSTTDPLHIIRRIQDMYEAKGSEPYILLLDWEKAFDKVSTDGLDDALRRMGVSQHYREVVADIYRHPQFCVETHGCRSQQATASSGIRQGCPLSPYLFLLVHTVLLLDARQGATEENGGVQRNSYSSKHPLTNLRYADDTLVVGRTAAALQCLLHHIQAEAAHYNLQLNLGKCELLRSKNTGEVRFLDGTPVKVVTKAKYLGAILTANGTTAADVSARISKANHYFACLQSF